MAGNVRDTTDAVARNRPPTKNDKKTTDNDLRNTCVFLGGVAIIGHIALILWAGSRTGQSLSTFAVGELIMGGAGLIGGVLGLLFGIPKSVSDPASVAPAPPNNADNSRTSVVPNSGQRSGYTVNTNLEQISDWLTKIIVGVGLTEIPAIRSDFHKIATYFGDAFIAETPSAVSAGAPVVAAAIIVYGVTSGFLSGYLFTRIFLPGAFERVNDALRKQNTELVDQIAEVTDSTEAAGRIQGEIYNELYRYKEEGFRTAIDKIENLLASPANQRNPALWTYLAAAHGQAYSWESEKRPDTDPAKKQLLTNHRDQALQAVRTALQLGDGWKPVLQLMWDKQHPAKTKEGMGKDEDDLEVFYDDKAFKDLLGPDS